MRLSEHNHICIFETVNLASFWKLNYRFGGPSKRLLYNSRREKMAAWAVLATMKMERRHGI